MPARVLYYTLFCWNVEYSINPKNILYVHFALESRLIYLYILYLSYSLLAIIISYVEMFAKLSWLYLAWVLFLGLKGQSPSSPLPWMWQQNSSSTHSPKIVKYSQPMWSAKCHWPQNKYLIRRKSRMESGCVQSKQVFPSCLCFTFLQLSIEWSDMTSPLEKWALGIWAKKIIQGLWGPYALTQTATFYLTGRVVGSCLSQLRFSTTMLWRLSPKLAGGIFPMQWYYKNKLPANLICWSLSQKYLRYYRH